MKIDRLSYDLFRIELSRDELRGVANCVNEAVNGVRIPDRAIKLGAKEGEINALLDILCSKLKRPQRW